MDRTKLARRKKEIEIELDNGERVSVPLNTLSIAGTDKYLELSFEIAEKTREEIYLSNIGKENSAIETIKAVTTGTFSIGLKNSEPLWQLMTGIKDIKFIYNAYPDDLIMLQEEFEKINPIIKDSKKKLQKDLIMIQALKTFAGNILSGKQELSESFTESVKLMGESTR